MHLMVMGSDSGAFSPPSAARRQRKKELRDPMLLQKYMFFNSISLLPAAKHLNFISFSRASSAYQSIRGKADFELLTNAIALAHCVCAANCVELSRSDFGPRCVHINQKLLFALRIKMFRIMLPLLRLAPFQFGGAKFSCTQ